MLNATAPAPIDTAHPPPTEQSVRLLLGLLVLLALGLMAVTEWSYQRAAAAQTDWFEQSRSRAAAQTLLSRLVDAETAQRGYLLTGRTDYLAPYQNAELELMAALKLLQSRNPPSSALHELVKQAGESALRKLSELKLTLELHDQGRHEAWRNIFLTDIGRDSMSDLRAATAALLVASNQALDRAQAEVSRTLQIGRVAVLSTTLFCLLGAVLYLRKRAALLRAHHEHLLATQRAREQLEGQVRDRTLDIGLVHQQQQNLRDDERLMLARALHDELGARLTAAKLDITRLRRLLPADRPELKDRLQHLADNLDEGIALKRRTVEDLMPSPLHQLGLRQAVEQLVTEFSQRTGLSVHAELDDVLPGDTASRNISYQLVKECLSNVERHAQASVVDVSLQHEEKALQIRVKDDGRGFEPLRPGLKSFGLKSLRYRLEMLGGQLNVVSAPGQGTEILARVALQAAD